MSFDGQVVIVTGAAQGIGREVAVAYARKGANVVFADRNEEEGAAAAAAVRNEGYNAIFVECDVRNEEDIIRLIRTVEEEYGGIHILINNAGVAAWRSPYELTVDEWDDILNSNVRSCFLATREAAKVMKRNSNGGSVVNMTSTRAFMSEPDTEAYAASKGAIAALTHAMAISLGKDNIQVNCISPGWIETAGYEQLRPKDHEQHPSGRVGTPEDIAKACLYLTQVGNDFVTGTNIVIDGGMTRKMIYQP